jgi:uncharacterized protein YciI
MAAVDGAWAARAAHANFALRGCIGMLFVIIGHDGPNGAALMPTVRHARPVAESGRMFIGGPFTDGSGSLIIVDMESEAAALEFASNDPYVREGVFERVEVKPFRKVLHE